MVRESERAREGEGERECIVDLRASRESEKGRDREKKIERVREGEGNIERVREKERLTA